MPDLGNLDPATYMSPMDLYDSIFWGKRMKKSSRLEEMADQMIESPDPFNTGVDSMNFDFLSHPPPGQPQQQFYF
jgi:hypothetical protein